MTKIVHESNGSPVGDGMWITRVRGDGHARQVDGLCG